MNVCAACHARRSTIAESGPAGAPLEDTHRLALLAPPNYHADGQQREEVYTWGSFLQSRMHQRGVTCMDCHEPHASKLRAEGNALRARCHNAAAFDTEKHHFHNAGSEGAQCVECHMPAQNYMVVDPRRDHSIRVPRPDLSVSIGSPNACTQCHADRKPDWASAALDRWYGKAWRERRHYGTTLHAGATQGAKALPSLLSIADDPALPSIVKATAATLAPDNARYGYVHAVGLHSVGRRGEALSVLRATEARHPYDLEILGTLVSMIREAGRPRDALPYARKIAEALPDDPGVKRVVAELEGAQ